MLEFVKKHKYFCMAVPVAGVLGWIAATADQGEALRKAVVEMTENMEKAVEEIGKAEKNV